MTASLRASAPLREPDSSSPRPSSFDERSGGSGHAFTLQLASAASPGELRKWLAEAAPGERAEYARGPFLPRDTEGVRLATQWKDAGLVAMAQHRDPADGRRFLYLIEKSDPGAVRAPAADGAAPLTPSALPLESGRIDADRLQALLLAELRACAARSEACPSNAVLARRIGLPAKKRSRDRVQYLLARLIRARAIAVEYRGTCAPRVVTVLAGGAK
jgi:hypothetical protein